MTTQVSTGVATIATQAEAEAGTATDKFMTPERAKQAIDVLADGGLTGAAITGQASATPAAGDQFLIADADDSNNLKRISGTQLRALMFTPDYESGNITINTDGTYISTNAHSLSGAPTRVDLYMKCTSAEAGYATDDLILHGPGVGNITGPTVSWDGTNIYIAYEGTVFDVADRTTGATARLAETANVLDNFVWILKAWV